VNYLDLFSGIGGFALGAYWAGLRFERHYFSEIDPWCVQLYQRRFPDAVSLGDVSRISKEKLSGRDWIITGGFPCQDISAASPTKTGLKGERSGLWYQFHRLIGDLRPRFAIVENSGELSNRGLSEICGSLSEIRYDSEWQIIRASDFGAPHERERLWIVAYPADFGFQEPRLPGWKRANELESFSLRSWPQRPSAVANIPRRIDGLSNRVDRLRGLGNSIVPQIAEMIFRELRAGW
jgi:DNA (cytosine-5)-methyltransferase 1